MSKKRRGYRSKHISKGTERTGERRFEDKGETLKRILAISSFLPQKIILSKILLKKSSDYEFLPATLFFVDISGFTSMSEKLSILGKEGAEELTRIINVFFEPIIRIILDYGGDIYRFGGDAILAIFTEGIRGFHKEVSALEAARRIVDFARKNRRIETKKGPFQIRLHIALASGEVYFKDLGNDFFVGGRLANRLIRIVEMAKPGEILVNAVVRRVVDEKFINIEKGVWKCMKKNSKLLQPEAKKDIKQMIQDRKTSLIKNLLPYLSEWIRERIELKPAFDPRDGEHRKVTCVFLHFSKIPYEKAPLRSASLLSGFYKEVRETAEKYGGYVDKLDVSSTGERALIVFGFPVALEDEDKRASLFAYDMINNPFINSKCISLRMGVNSGFVFSGLVGSDLRRELTVMGDAVNLTARIAHSARSGEILVSESVYYNLFKIFNFKIISPKHLKGKKEKVRLYKMLKKKVIEKSIVSGWLSESEKIVGRTKEMAKLKKIVHSVKKKEGQIVTITGDAGIGKSRLTQELIRELKKLGFYILEGKCFPYGSTFSFYPWVHILVKFFGILPADSIEIRKKKIRKRIAMINPKLSKWVPVIGEIMGVSFPETSFTKFLDARTKKQKVFDMISDSVKFVSKKKPVCIILEDLHWADTASVELVNYIVRNIADKAIIIVLVYRPIKRKEEFMDKEFTTKFILKELTKKDSLSLVENLLKIKDIHQDFRRQIVNKSQGNPFYIEELLKSLIEQGLVVEQKGRWKFKGDIEKLQLPDTVEAVILSRIDRLNIQEKDVLQVASVLGREFEYFLIEGIYPGFAHLKKSLSNLQNLDIIKKEKGKRQIRYIFKHILTREVAYETLSYARKRELHRKVGEFIENRLKVRREEFLGSLSYHFYEGRDYDKALLYSFKAGKKAMSLYTNEEAIEFFTRAIESYENMETEKQST